MLRKSELHPVPQTSSSSSSSFVRDFWSFFDDEDEANGSPSSACSRRELLRADEGAPGGFGGQRFKASRAAWTRCCFSCHSARRLRWSSSTAGGAFCVNAGLFSRCSERSISVAVLASSLVKRAFSASTSINPSTV